MLFTSAEFAVLLTCLFLAFHYAGDRSRWMILLVGSLVFYAGLKSPYPLAALAVVTLVSYACGLAIERSHSERSRGLIFRGGVLATVMVLVLMRYLPFLATNANLVFRLTGRADMVPIPEPIVAVGVSFFAFQAISYLNDIHRGTLRPEAHLGRYALYLSFFPKLLQGPIERGEDLLPQLRRPYVFDYEAVRSGLLLLAMGLFKKLVIADRLAVFVNPAYASPHSYTGLPLIMATCAYAFQIYFDFSGYTDMALGMARLFGIRLTGNFNAPYLATSIADFWRRWHITFSRWILDYIFMPAQIQWRRARALGTVAALLVTFLVCGVWHGPSWHFVAWGALHGVYMSGSALAGPRLRKLYRLLRLERTRALKVWQVGATFSLVCLAWIFFRAQDLSEATYIVMHLFSGLPNQIAQVFAAGSPVAMARTAHEVCFPGQSLATSAILAVGIGLIEALQALDRPQGRHRLLAQPAWVRWPVYYALAAFVLVCGDFGQSQYVYFQF